VNDKMDYTPVTPFRRTIDAAILKHQAATQEDLPPTGANKWEVLRELAAARVAFGLSDRDLTVLQALVSFHQATILGGNDSELIVHPSNKAICERLNGMPCSTMRRHLSNLVQTGFVVRRDSPNGKRYARRYGDEKVAFGFDLSPLVLRFQEVCEAAEAVRAAEERYKRLRATVSLMRRDLAGLAEYGSSLRPDLGLWDQFSDLAVLTARDLRRKLEMADLKQIEKALGAALDQARDLLGDGNTEYMSTNDANSEQHHQNSNKDLYDFEPRLEKARDPGNALERADAGVRVDRREDEGDPPQELEDQLMPNIPLGLVLASCQEIKSYVEQPVRHWHDLVRVADIVRPMMGISPSAWDEAKRYMGPEEASVVVVAMLERFGDIRSPGGYLRFLSAKAAIGEFSCGPMIMALMRRDAA
jgi:replication initiation protein RepC